MLNFISRIGNAFTFNRSSVLEAYKEGSMTVEKKKLFYEAAHSRSDAAELYLTLYKDELSKEERNDIFNVLLQRGRDHTLLFMKKNMYTEEERLKFKEKLEKMLKVFFKYRKQLPDLLRDEEKAEFYQKHKKNLLTNVFRDDFNGLLEIFEDQLDPDEIEVIVNQMLKLKGKRGSFLSQLIDYIEIENIQISKEKLDLLLANTVIDRLMGE